MPLNLGSSAVTLYLGDQPVNAYLGEVLLTAPTALVFTGAVDGEWTNTGNWAGGVLPTAEDSVIATASIIDNSGSLPTVVDFTINGSAGMGIAITVTGMATFNDESVNVSTVTGNATFNDNSVNDGTVTGNATFNNDSSNFGTVNGTVTCDTSGACTPT